MSGTYTEIKLNRGSHAACLQVHAGAAGWSRAARDQSWAERRAARPRHRRAARPATDAPRPTKRNFY